MPKSPRSSPAAQTSPQARFTKVITAFRETPSVTPPSDKPGAFGSRALKVSGRIFAMLVGEELVVKLPAGRVAELVETGTAKPFENKGRRMKEWVVVGAGDEWVALAREAYRFVAGAP